MRHRVSTRAAIVGLNAIIGLGLGACSADDTSPFTVAYYKEHEAERKAMLIKCNNDPGHLKGTPQCINARQASLAEGSGSLRSLPPMGLLEDDRQSDKQRSAD